MYKFVVLACAVAAVAAEADPSLAYANGLHYAGAYAALPAAGYAAGYAPYAAGYAPINYAAAVHAPVAPAVVHAAPAASAYALPPVRTRAEAPIVETVVEPVEQWGYKVAY